jgi:thioredoxin-like negative regulator of GroEL
MSIPTLMVFKGGKPVRQFIGVTNANTLKSVLLQAAAV